MREKWAHLTPDNAKQVVISWRDIRSVSSWDENDDGDIRPCRHLNTVGWLLYQGPDPGEPSSEIIVIASTYDWEASQWAEFNCFPKVVWKEVSQYERIP